MTAAYVGRWHADDGFHTVIVEPNGRKLRLLVPGHPVVVRTLPAAEARHVTELVYPLRRAVRLMRAMARNNAGKSVRRFLDRVKP